MDELYELDLNPVERFIIEKYLMIRTDEWKRTDVIKYISDNRKLYQQVTELKAELAEVKKGAADDN